MTDKTSAGSSKERLVAAADAVIQRSASTSASANHVIVHRQLMGELREALFAFIADHPSDETPVLPRDKLGWICSICGCWNHPGNQLCEHRNQPQHQPRGELKANAPLCSCGHDGRPGPGHQGNCPQYREHAENGGEQL